MRKPRNIAQNQAWDYLQQQPGQVNLKSENEPGTTETLSCSDFEEEQMDNQTKNDPGSGEKSLKPNTTLTASDFDSSSQNETQSESVPNHQLFSNHH